MPEKKHAKTTEPGTEIQCKHCSQSTKLVLRDYFLECSSCGTQVQSYQQATPDSISSSMDPERSHHGPGARPGDRSRGSMIDSSGRDSQGARLGRTWTASGRRLARIDRVDESKRAGSRSRLRAKRLITENTPKGNLRTLSLDLLDFGWPLPGSERPEGFREIWRDAHPFGVGASAAACKVMASSMLGVDCRIQPLCSEMIPDADQKTAKRSVFRSLKSLRRGLGTRAIRGESHKREVTSILDMANLGQTRYRDVSADLHRLVSEVMDSGEFNLSPPRSILAALLHHLADLNGIRVNQIEITRLMGCSRGYRERSLEADSLVRRFL